MKPLSDKTIIKIYNRVLDIISFISILAFVACKIAGVLQASWLYVLIPIILPDLFYIEEKNSSEDKEGPLYRN